MLFSTQMTVLDATSRIMSENLLILKHRTWDTRHLSKIYYSFLWFQILFGVIIFLLNIGQPFLLLTISALINAFAMFAYILLTLWLNMRKLEKPIRPSLIRIVAMIAAFIFFGFLTIKTLISF